MAVANGGSKKKRHRWFEEFLLSLNPRKLYGTGDIVSEWEENEQILKEIREKHDKNPKGAQPALSRYMPERYKMFVKSSSDQNPKAALIYQPVKTETYKQTGHEQQIYLGAQYAWVAADYLEVEQPMGTEEVLELCRNASPKPEQQAPVTADEKLLPSEARTQESGLSLGLDTQDLPKSAPRFFSIIPQRIYPGLAVAISVLALICSVGIAGNIYFSDSAKKLEGMVSAYDSGGVAMVKESIVQGQKAGSKADIYQAAWLAANDPQKDFPEVKSMLEPLLSDANFHWQAKADHTLGLASMNRGDLFKALGHFEEAESKLIGVTKGKEDLKIVYIDMAKCYFYLGNSEALIEKVKLARLIGIPFRDSALFHYEARYWFLLGDVEQAISFTQKALKLAQTTEEASFSAYYHSNLGLYHTILENYKISYHHLKKGQAVAAQTQNGSLFIVLHEYERFWARKMDLPYSGTSATNSKTSFPSERKFIDFIMEVAHENTEK